MWPCCPYFTEEKDDEEEEVQDEDEDEEQLNWKQELEDRLLKEFPQEEQDDGEEEEPEASAEDRIGTEISERFDRDDSNLTMIVVNIVLELTKLILIEMKSIETDVCFSQIQNKAHVQ